MHELSLDLEVRRRPHDALFRGVFADPARAAELLRACLPRAATHAIRWRHLRAVPGSFVDEDLRDHISDLMFAAPLRRGIAHLYAVLEHRRRHARWVAFHVHRYVTRHLVAWAAQHPRARLLPPVLPFVIHQGPAPFRAAATLSELIDQHGLPPLLRRHQPELRLFVFDLQAHDLDGMALPLLSRLPLLHLQQVPERRDTGRLLQGWRSQLRHLLAARGGLPIFDRLVRYVATVSTADQKTLKRAYRKIHRHAETRYVTVADQLIEAGEIGGQRKLLRTQLEARFGAMPRAVERRLAAATSAELTRWAKRVLVARKLADVID